MARRSGPCLAFSDRHSPGRSRGVPARIDGQAIKQEARKGRKEQAKVAARLPVSGLRRQADDIQTWRNARHEPNRTLS
jgi:hypothetical protein